MKKKQQATVEIKVTTETNRPPFPFEEELVSLIRKAIAEGYSQNQTIIALKQCWVENLPDLPEETEDEKVFRAQAEKFLNAKYEEFISWADEKETNRPFRILTWEREWCRTREMDYVTRRKFVCEVCCTIYKGSKMESFDKNAVKSINIERTKIMFPELKRNYSRFYREFVDALLQFSLEYNVEGVKEQQLEEFLEQFELSGKDDANAAKFIWLVENFN